MGATSLGQLAYVKETVPGTTPATPAFKVIDMTSEDLTMNVTQSRSAAITPQRVVRSSRRTSKEVGNGFNFELYKATEIDSLLASLLGQTAFSGSPLTAKAGGTVVDSYTFERKLAAGDFRRFTGCQIGSMEFTFAPEAIIGVRATVTGFSMISDTAIVAGATYTAATTTAEKLTAIDVASITASNGLVTALDYESITLNVNNQLVARKRLGPNAVRGITQNQVLVTGSMRAYVDKTVADVFIGDTNFDLDIQTLNAAQGYTFLLKDIKLTSYGDPNTGNGDEYMSNFDFECCLDATFASSFGISKTS